MKMNNTDKMRTYSREGVPMDAQNNVSPLEIPDNILVAFGRCLATMQYLGEIDVKKERRAENAYNV